MTHTTRRIGVLASLLLGLGLVLALLPAVTPTPKTSAPVAGIVQAQPAQAALNDLVLKSSVYSVDALKVCHNWGVSTCSNGIGYLNAGENTKSKFGWADVDGIYVPSGEHAYNSFYGTAWGPGWYKLAGCAGCTRTERVYWN